MDKKYREWLTIKEFELCYPVEYLEYLETFELDDQNCVLLDENAMKKIDLLLKKDAEIKIKKFNDRIEQTTTTKENPQLEKLSFSNNFDNVNENLVYSFFKTELVDKKYLTETDLFKYLDLAFDKKIVPINKIRFIQFRTKKSITKIFYKYYKTISIGKQGEQNKYIKLLSDYFEGFEFETLKTNFNK